MSYCADKTEWTHAHTHALTHALTYALTHLACSHCGNYVSLPASELDNKMDPELLQSSSTSDSELPIECSLKKNNLFVLN